MREEYGVECPPPEDWYTEHEDAKDYGGHIDDILINTHPSYTLVDDIDGP